MYMVCAVRARKYRMALSRDTPPGTLGRGELASYYSSYYAPAANLYDALSRGDTLENFASPDGELLHELRCI